MRAFQSQSIYPNEESKFEKITNVAFCNQPFNNCNMGCREAFSKELREWNNLQGHWTCVSRAGAKELMMLAGRRPTP